MARLEGIRVYPIKGLDGIELEEARVLGGGTLAFDREFALFEGEEVINGKRTPQVHDLRTDFDPDRRAVTVETPNGESATFDLADGQDRERAAAWFGEFFGANLALRQDDELGFVDRRSMGPSVISTGTIEEIASWFEEMSPESARRRLRANVEVSGVPAFWEDRFVGAGAPEFEVGGVRFEGVTPCGRCVVPERDPDTGETIADFREQFVEQRRERFPEWADPDAFEHFYTAMLIARVPEPSRRQSITVGDPVAVSASPRTDDPV